MDHARLLVADDEPTIRESYAALLSHAGYEVSTAENGDQVLERVRAERYDMLFLDMVTFPPTDGVTVLREVKRINPSTLVVGFSGQASVPLVVDAYRAGAFEFVEKPVPRDRLLELAERGSALQAKGAKRRRLAEDLEAERQNLRRLREQLAQEDPFRQLVGSSTMFRDLLATLREVARTDSTVLLTGESGTGKGRVARAIHELSSRREGPFVEANCVVYSEGVLHSELFGHERGAFTGAARTKKGRFELARGGTLFLDEIGEIAASTQLLLLRVLQDRTFERVGGEETLEADVRLIAATNRDLEQAIHEGSFRSDLYYRLNVIPVALPALREHADDIPVLAQHFLAQSAERSGNEVRFSDDALAALIRHAWPGNIRELENLVERLVVLNRDGVIGLSDLPESMRDELPDKSSAVVPGTLQDLERLRIVEVLREANGNKKRAALALGIHRSTLYSKMRRYGLMEPEDKETAESPSDSAPRSESS